MITLGYFYLKIKWEREEEKYIYTFFVNAFNDIETEDITSNQ